MAGTTRQSQKVGSPLSVAGLTASAFGGIASAFVSPALFWLALIFTPTNERGFWTDPNDVLFFAPLMALFALFVTVPVSLLIGPLVLKLAGHLPAYPVVTAALLGAIVAIGVLYVPPALSGNLPGTFPWQILAFGASCGSIGAVVTARKWRYMCSSQ